MVNNEQYNNKVSNDIKPSKYKETESVPYKTNLSNHKHNEFGSEPIFKEESYITSVRVVNIIKLTLYLRERKKNQNKMQRKILLTLEDLNWRIKSQLMKYQKKCLTSK